MYNLQFETLCNQDAIDLVKPFSMEEVKQTIWDCQSFKSPGANEINFGFIKDFWEEIKNDTMWFIIDFHRNDSLAKGIIALL